VTSHQHGLTGLPWVQSASFGSMKRSRASNTHGNQPLGVTVIRRASVPYQGFSIVSSYSVSKLVGEPQELLCSPVSLL
jgi:hypothetical protein